MIRKALLIALLLTLPQIASATSFVLDDNGSLSPSDRSQLSEQFSQISTEKNVLLVARLVGPLNGVTIDDRARQIRQLLETENPNVVAIVVAWSDRKAFIATSNSVKQLLSDSSVNDIFQRTLVPALRRSDVYGGLSAVGRDFGERLPVMAVRQPLSQQANNVPVPEHQSSNSGILTFIFFLAIFAIATVDSRRRRLNTAWQASRTPDTSTVGVSSAYTSHVYRAPATYDDDLYPRGRIYPSQQSTNIIAPVIINENDRYVDNTNYNPTPNTPVPSVDQGGGAGGSFDVAPDPSPATSDWGSSASSSSDDSWSSGSSDSGGGSGGGFDSGGGSGGDF